MGGVTIAESLRQLCLYVTGFVSHLQTLGVASMCLTSEQVELLGDDAKTEREILRKHS